MSSELSNRPNTAPTPEEVDSAAAVLQQLEPGFLPKPLFLEVTRLVVTPIVEVVPLRMTTAGPQVLLLQRPEDDPNWPGMLHTPGTVLRATDVDDGINGAFQRIFADELGVAPANPPQFVETVFHKVNRGSEIATVFSIDMGDADAPGGTWYDARALPETIVDTQIEFIRNAVTQFETPRTNA